MTTDGLFASLDESILEFFGLSSCKLIQRTTCREITSRSDRDGYRDLITNLYTSIERNCVCNRGKERWRLEQCTELRDSNRNREILLQRAIGMLGKHNQPEGWFNHVPTASGLTRCDAADKHRSVDLVRFDTSNSHLHLIELKWQSDNPVYAAFEILKYGLAYLYCRNHRTETAGKDAMGASRLTLSVLAPSDFYFDNDKRGNWELSSLQSGLDIGLKDFVKQKILQPHLAFTFLSFPKEFPKSSFAEEFPNGAAIKAHFFPPNLSHPAVINLRTSLGNLVQMFPPGSSCRDAVD